MGEYCHDNSANAANRAPAGTCEWNLINKAGQLRLAVLRRQQLGGQHDVPLELRDANAATGPQYDCSLATLPSDIRYAPAGETPVEPTNDGLDTLPGAGDPGDDLEEVPGRRRRPEHGRLR